jgi:molybdopterin-guanine dinucleotide biosynthesis protein A
VDAVGFAVAGGRSRRMGRDKALLAWGKTDLLGHTLDRLRAACPQVRILSGPERRYAERGVPVVLDRTSDAGSLAGVVAGLETAEGPGLFLGLDLPFVPTSLLAHLLALAEGADAVVPISPSGPEPLCAVYGHECLGPARRAIAEGRLKMTAFWPDVRVQLVEAAELAAFGDPGRLFRNLNTPEEYEAARRLP